ncbi:IS66 family insertion sequence element accessory protein TnpA [Caballeronia sordidicola]|nr:hypothetical protein [Caballeronia sordidicola]
MANRYDERRQVWAKRFEDQKNSGLSVLAWCKAEGVNQSGFYRSRRRMLEVSGSQAKANLIAVPMNPGVDREMRLDDENCTDASEARHAPLEIQTPTGFVVRLGSRTHLDWLPRLLAVL